MQAYFIKTPFLEGKFDRVRSSKVVNKTIHANNKNLVKSKDNTYYSFKLKRLKEK